jgi:hypothetical protein
MQMVLIVRFLALLISDCKPRLFSFKPLLVSLNTRAGLPYAISSCLTCDSMSALSPLEDLT